MRKNNELMKNYHYLADYTIVWVLGGQTFLFFAISMIILYFRIKHYIGRPITLPLLLKDNNKDNVVFSVVFILHLKHTPSFAKCHQKC